VSFAQGTIERADNLLARQSDPAGVLVGLKGSLHRWCDSDAGCPKNTAANPELEQ